MKNISLALKSLKNEELRDLSVLLGCRRSGEKDITGAILSVSGLAAVVSVLSPRELEIFRAVYQRSEGMTYGEIEKTLKIPVPEIENLTNTLASRLLVYRIKNRQLLTNKLDKIYGISEIAHTLNLADGVAVAEHLKKIVKALESWHGESRKHHDRGLEEILARDRVRELMELIIESGFMITLEDAREVISKKSFDSVFSLLLEKSVIRIFYCIDARNTFLISLDAETAPNLVPVLVRNAAPGRNIHNRYYFILNLLNAYDTISTYGLFLTKQNVFRKIDKKRIADSMFRVFHLTGTQVQPEECALLSLAILSELKCLKLQKDIASISLKNIRDGIDEPQKFLALILMLITSHRKTDPFFPMPVETPKYRTITIIINHLLKLKKTTGSSLKYLTLAALNMDYYEASSTMGGEARQEKNDFDAALGILSLLGIIEIREGLISLSDIGHDVVPFLQGIRPETVAQARHREEPQKCIYINPDFTLIVPVEEIGSLALYHLLTHTEMVKQDFVIHAVITREAIVKAHKRGLTLKNFYDKLTRYSKNEIPQNLNFLLKEWANQTINIKISHAVLLKSNQTTFIEEILSGKLKDSIIEQLSPNHAIINISYIDDIIKIARKNDAVISLFEE